MNLNANQSTIEPCQTAGNLMRPSKMNADLSDVLDTRSDIPLLEDWGRWVRIQRLPGPGRVKSSSMWSLLVSKRDGDDPVPERVLHPDRSEQVNDMIMRWSVSENIRHCEYARYLIAYYCEYPGSVRKCVHNVPAVIDREPAHRTAQQNRIKYNRFAARDFSVLLKQAEAVFLARWEQN